MTPAAAARFFAKVDKSGDCWLWTASKLKGYGAFVLDGKLRLAHRLSYEMARGTIPEGLQLDHLCRTPACVNPAHLEAVTPRENQLRGDGVSGKAARQTACLRGHPFDEANTYTDGHNRRHCRACGREKMRERRGPATYRQEHREAMVEAIASGLSNSEVAHRFGVTRQRAWQLRHEVTGTL